MAEIDAMITDLAAKVGGGDRGLEVVAAMRTRRREISQAVAGERRVRVLLVFGITPIVVAGPESFPSEMVELANGENVIATGGAYPTLNIERLITLNPEVVISAAMLGTPGARGDGIGRDDPGWREMAAVREGRVVALRDEALIRPGPRIGDGLAALARALHPNASVP
jgi:iron complex transport system substrate-binding protein